MTDKEYDKDWVVEILGMVDYNHYLRFKENAINGMLVFGDSFIEALGLALSESDDSNAVKLIRTFRNECSTHEILYRIHEAKQIALDNKSTNFIEL